MSEHSQSGFFSGNPKMLFTFGLVTGIALTLVFNNIAGIAIAAPSGNGGGSGTAVKTAPTPTQPTAKAGELAPVTKDDHSRGNAKAKVTIVEYSDFQCPFCERHHPTLQKVMDDYGDKVQWVYRHFPLTSIHPQAMPSALASECAAEQGKFWEYSDELFKNQDSLSAEYYSTLAGELGLNQNKFDECVSSKKYQSVVDEDIASGSAAGVTGTPATFINGQLISGAVPYESIKQVIDAELAK
jgi:protein-disulfide isomerase